jgi:hypothetical protein
MGFLSMVSSRMEEMKVKQRMVQLTFTLTTEDYHMSDLRVFQKGFFTLSKVKNWLSKLLINLNPPLRQQMVPVRVKSTYKRPSNN